MIVNKPKQPTVVMEPGGRAEGGGGWGCVGEAAARGRGEAAARTSEGATRGRGKAAARGWGGGS
jgi:hypothetical protein